MGKKSSIETENSNSLPKKRGRKPKGGKIISEMISNEDGQIDIPNIILHLNCNTIDMTELFDNKMKYNPDLSTIENYNTNDEIFSNNYTFINETNNNSVNNSVNREKNVINEEMVNKKIETLTHNLHENKIEKTSACFWCSYNFENDPCFIPKAINTSCKTIKTTQSTNNTNNTAKMCVYGCFCCPQCAVAYLMNENIDTTTKYERYYLLNYIYDKSGEIVIKPAPSPHYMLDKFCGNLSIDEYRNLITQDNLIMIDNKPLSRVFPELFEDNTDYINSMSLNNKYKIKPYQSSSTANSKSMF